MMPLNDQEIIALQQLENEDHQQEVFHINVLIHVIGSFLGWISIIIFLAISKTPPLVFAWIGFIQMAVVLLMYRRNTISTSLSILLIVLGHVTFMIGLTEAFRLDIYHFLMIESVLTLLTFYIYDSKTYHVLQSTFLFLIIFAIAMKDFFNSYWILAFWSLSLIVLLYLWLRPKAQLLSVRISLILVQSLYMLLLFLNQSLFRPMRSDPEYYTEILQMHSFITSLFLALFILYSFSQLRKHLLSLMLLAVMLYLSWFAYQAITLPILFLALSFYSNERYLRNFSLLLLAIFLIYYYYMLRIPLDEKAFILMLTGFLLLAVSFLIKPIRLSQ